MLLQKNSTSPHQVCSSKREHVHFHKRGELVTQGKGKIRSETVKGLVEYARTHNDAQIRTLYGGTDRVEIIIEQENNRLIETEVMARGTLSYLGLLLD